MRPQNVGYLLLIRSVSQQVLIMIRSFQFTEFHFNCSRLGATHLGCDDLRCAYKKGRNSKWLRLRTINYLNMCLGGLHENPDFSTSRTR